jgi:hypothetical protein
MFQPALAWHACRLARESILHAVHVALPLLVSAAFYRLSVSGSQTCFSQRAGMISNTEATEAPKAL